ncbi:GL13884 [Drosophila persimilis]|uniref:GL13884 n=1 Tax=Drosophila persimilis TaxID=7234 RepID=B4GPI3_DROPE|nr:GL13884 [Drosophila persimilis]
MEVAVGRQAAAGINSSSVVPNYPTGYGSTGRGGVKANYAHGGTDPIWYMCDDDKIKAMTQREFEELLSPSRKITITPYLLFYARFDLQPPSKPSGTASSSTPPPPSASSQSSWSNEALSGSGVGSHKI